MSGLWAENSACHVNYLCTFDIVIICLGGNDVSKKETVVAWCQPVSADEVYEHLKNIIVKLEKNGIKVWASSVLQRRNKAGLKNAEITILNKLLLSYMKGKFIGLSQVVKCTPGNMTDNTHFTFQVYRRAFDLILQHMGN